MRPAKSPPKRRFAWSNYWMSLCAAVICGLLTTIAVFQMFLSPQASRSNLQAFAAGNVLADAAKDMLARIDHLEDLLIGVITVQLGILAYIAGVVFSKEQRIRTPRLFYGLVVVIMLACCSAYTQVFTMYTSSIVFVLQAEAVIGAQHPAAFKHILQTAYFPEVPGLAWPFVQAVRYIPFIALAPMLPAAGALFVLGKRFRIRTDVSLCICIIAVCVIALYVVPNQVAMLHLVRP